MEIYLIRHAQSHYNVGESAIESKHGPHYKQSEDYITFKYDGKLCDCSITEHGVQQSLEARKEMENIPIDVVLVSPLKRALETCHHIFHEHPSKPEIIVQPLFRQIMESCCDVGSRLKEAVAEHPHWNFATIKNHSGWYIDELEPLFREWVYSRVPEHQRDDHKLLEKESLQMLKHFRKEGITVDTEECMKARQLRQLAYLKEKYAGKRVAVVSHSEMIKHYVGIKIKNCEVRKFKVE